MKLLIKGVVLWWLQFILYPGLGFGQTAGNGGALKAKLKQLQQQENYLQDTAYAAALLDLAYFYSTTYPDSALLLLKGSADRCREIGYKSGEADTYMIIGDAFQVKGMFDKALENYEKLYKLAKHTGNPNTLPLTLNRIGLIALNQGNYPEALHKFYESLKAAEAIHNNEIAGATLNNIAVVYFHQDKFSEAETAYRQRLKLALQMADTSRISLCYNGLGEVKLKQKKPAEALEYLTVAYNLASKIDDRKMMLNVQLSLAEAYYETDSLQKAASLFEDALFISKQTDNGTDICTALIGLAKVQFKEGLLKKALANGLEALQKAESMGQVQLMRDANEIVSTIYAALNNSDSAFQYYKAYKLYSDSINSLASQRASAVEKASYEFSKKEIEFERKALQQRWITLSALAALLLVAAILWLINRNRQRLNLANKELQKKNEIIQTQKLKAEETLTELKATQKQLIQSEKMASLGELTAGIAHEIQNPLNFVSNFSEVGAEMIEELLEEYRKPRAERDEAMENDIISDIKQNLEKINYHGKRADAIVKGMLQHSRQSSGKKEPTDINKLADEYLRLSYHGLRAKDKTFNAAFKTDFDESIQKINVVPQDIGRVLLNIINNAFYAVTERQQNAGGSQQLQAENTYAPTVTLVTKNLGDAIEIQVKDNGNGIPQSIVDKIFQPFFTTKPTGSGTGLGLSLSYDIIKAHAGDIKVETLSAEAVAQAGKEEAGTKFIITLPV